MGQGLHYQILNLLGMASAPQSQIQHGPRFPQPSEPSNIQPSFLFCQGEQSGSEVRISTAWSLGKAEGAEIHGKEVFVRMRSSIGQVPSKNAA